MNPPILAASPPGAKRGAPIRRGIALGEPAPFRRQGPHLQDRPFESGNAERRAETPLVGRRRTRPREPKDSATERRRWRRTALSRAALSVPIAVTSRDSITVAHRTSSSANWDTKPVKRIRRTFLRRGPTHRASFYADLRWWRWRWRYELISSTARPSPGACHGYETSGGCRRGQEEVE